MDTDFFNSAGILNGESNRLKGSVYEGGIRVPFIASWPKLITKGSKSDHISGFQDFFPTVCEILDIDSPYKIDGISYLPTLIDENQKKHKYLYWEIASKGGLQAVRYGKWKGIKTDLQKGPQPLKLFNLEDDVTELNNVSYDNPMIVEKIESIMLNARTSPALEKFKIKGIDQ